MQGNHVTKLPIVRSSTRSPQPSSAATAGSLQGQTLHQLSPKRTKVATSQQHTAAAVTSGSSTLCSPGSSAAGSLNRSDCRYAAAEGASQQQGCYEVTAAAEDVQTSSAQQAAVGSAERASSSAASTAAAAAAGKKASLQKAPDPHRDPSMVSGVETGEDVVAFYGKNGQDSSVKFFYCVRCAGLADPYFGDTWCVCSHVCYVHSSLYCDLRPNTSDMQAAVMTASEGSGVTWRVVCAAGLLRAGCSGHMTYWLSRDRASGCMMSTSLCQQTV